MATPNRGSLRSKIPAATTMAAADALDDTDIADGVVDVSGCDRVLIAQIANGTAGTTGIDVIEISNDGSEWRADDTLLALASDDVTGTVVAALNAAGVEPTGAALFKSGPHTGTTFMRCSRGDAGGGTAWTTGAPTVLAIRVGA